jgi:hypothetical protein
MHFGIKNYLKNNHNHTITKHIKVTKNPELKSIG